MQAPDLRAGDRRTAERAAHTLKGVAGNIGAGEIGKAAAEIEKAIAGGRAAEAVEALVAGLDRGLQELLPRIAAVVGRPAATGRTARPGATSVAERAAAAERLAAFLKEGDIEAVRCFNAARQEMEEACTREQFDSLEKALRRYDFPGALRVLERLGGQGQG